MTINDRARTIHNIFKEYGFSDIASVSAIGNLEHESNLKPDVTEVEGFGGYGLAQWTPKENLYTQGSQLGYSRAECEQLDVQARIIAQATSVGQWTNAMSSNYDVNERISPLTFSEYKQMTDLTSATVNFMGHYLRPTYKSSDNKIYSERIPHAEKWKGILLDGSSPDPDPDPDPEPNPGLDLNQLFENVQQAIGKALSNNVFKNGNSQFYQNGYIQLISQLKNTYRVKANESFFKLIEDEFKNFNDDYLPDPEPNPDPDPDPPSTEEKYFPVKLGNGTNFWKRDNWAVGTLQRNMTYGVRSSGKEHSGYDIGAGGQAGKGIYATTSGTVTHVEQRSGAGQVIAIDHSTDDYHSLYMHLVIGSQLVQVGDSVTAGQKIATMGNSGGNYAIHLHYELSKTGQFHRLATTVNPENYLGVIADNQTNLKTI